MKMLLPVCPNATNIVSLWTHPASCQHLCKHCGAKYRVWIDQELLRDDQDQSSCDSVIVSSCHPVILSSCHPVTEQWPQGGHTVTVSLCSTSTMISSFLGWIVFTFLVWLSSFFLVGLSSFLGGVIFNFGWNHLNFLGGVVLIFLIGLFS